jgi:hypothetical protein
MKKIKTESTGIIFHSRNFKPTTSLKKAVEKARRNNSDMIKIYGKPELLVNPKTSKLYLRLRFSKEIEEKIKNRQIIIDKNLPYIIDDDTKNKIKKEKKKALKKSTKIWKK